MSPKNYRVSPERAKEILDYNPVSGDLTWKFRETGPAHFNTQFAGKKAGTVKKGYVQVVLFENGKNHFFGGHRLAWAIHHGTWPDQTVDHIDGNGLNNAINNLRLASYAENSAHKNEVRGKVPFKGVYFSRRHGKYASQIKAEGRWTWLGLHETATEAARAYDDNAFLLHGKFAKTNKSLGLL